MKKIALEEHFATQQHLDYLRSRKDYPRLETVEDENHNKVERLFRTPSSSQAFMCVYLTLGAERILFAVDHPFESNEVGARFIETIPISETDKKKICHLNAEKLLGL